MIRRMMLLTVSPVVTCARLQLLSFSTKNGRSGWVGFFFHVNIGQRLIGGKVGEGKGEGRKKMKKKKEKEEKEEETKKKGKKKSRNKMGQTTTHHFDGLLLQRWPCR